MKRLLQLIDLAKGLAQLIVTYMPGSIGFTLRGRYYRDRLKHLGKGVKIGVGVRFDNEHLVSIGDNCLIDKDVVIQAALPEETGREVVHVRNAAFRGVPGEVFIGRNVHVGIGAVIAGNYGGVHIGDNCAVAGGAKIYALSSHYRSRRAPQDTSVGLGSRIPHEKQCVIAGAVHLADNVGVALNAVILPGVSIATNSFVGINTVVERSFGSRENLIIRSVPQISTSHRFEKPRDRD